mmetsp:Transcript_44200/g.94148  ORF Transcript_44200/g.94148 Transcript_44200/m.94148 type:complete len:222 (+) Transcript_44200:1646-2311(+)
MSHGLDAKGVEQVLELACVDRSRTVGIEALERLHVGVPLFRAVKLPEVEKLVVVDRRVPRDLDKNFGDPVLPWASATKERQGVRQVVLVQLPLVGELLEQGLRLCVLSLRHSLLLGRLPLLSGPSITDLRRCYRDAEGSSGFGLLVPRGTFGLARPRRTAACPVGASTAAFAFATLPGSAHVLLEAEVRAANAPEAGVHPKAGRGSDLSHQQARCFLRARP